MRSIFISLLQVLLLHVVISASFLPIAHAFTARRNDPLADAHMTPPFQNAYDIRGGGGGSRSLQAAAVVENKKKKETVSKRAAKRNGSNDITDTKKKTKFSVDFRERKVQIGLLASLLFCYPIITM